MLFSRTSRGTNAEMLIEMENHAQDADRTCRHLLPGPIAPGRIRYKKRERKNSGEVAHKRIDARSRVVIT
jgi:hypothetical protein